MEKASQTIYTIIVLLALTGIAHGIAKHYGFFKRLQPDRSETRLRFLHILSIFVVYFLLMDFIFPIIFSWIYALFASIDPAIASNRVEGNSLGFLLGVVITLGTLLMMVKKISPELLKRIWKDKASSSSSYLTDILIGITAFFIAMPLLLSVYEILDLVIIDFFKKELIDQVAVEHLKKATEIPFALICSSLFIIFFGPLLEEFLFRGCLQTFIRGHLGPVAAILLTSFFFSFGHFSMRQAFSNISIVGALFVFSLYLGYVYERQRSLVSPWALHMTFNSINVIRILME